MSEKTNETNEIGDSAKVNADTSAVVSESVQLTTKRRNKMKANYRTWMAGLAMLGLAVLTAPNCAAQCGGLGGAIKLRTVGHLPLGEVRLLPAAFVGADDGDRHDDPDSIVGLWHVKFVVQVPGSSQSTTIDAGYAQWHSDGTEIMNSGSRPPSTSNFCLGVWQKVGEREYKLNHFAIAWTGDPTATSPLGPANIIEQVTLAHDGQSFTGSFTIVQYDENLNVKGQAAGTITGSRITVDTPPSSIF